MDALGYAEVERTVMDACASTNILPVAPWVISLQSSRAARAHIWRVSGVIGGGPDLLRMRYWRGYTRVGWWCSRCRGCPRRWRCSSLTLGVRPALSPLRAGEPGILTGGANTAAGSIP